MDAEWRVGTLKVRFIGFLLVEKGAGVFKPISELGNSNPKLAFIGNRLATVAKMKIP